jgi:hypothetical protein
MRSLFPVAVQLLLHSALFVVQCCVVSAVHGECQSVSE